MMDAIYIINDLLENCVFLSKYNNKKGMTIIP